MGPDVPSSPSQDRPDRSKIVRRGFFTTVVLYLALSVYYPAVVMTKPHTDWGIAVEFALIAFCLLVLFCLPLAVLTLCSWRHVSLSTRIMGLLPLTFPVTSMVLAGIIEGLAEWVLG